MSTESRSGELRFGTVRVCKVDQVFESAGTFYGRPSLTICPGDGELNKRLMDFVEFSIEWNRRVAENGAEAPDADEFSTYEDLIGPGKWVARIGDGRALIDGAPVFSGDEVSWVCPLDSASLSSLHIEVRPIGGWPSFDRVGALTDLLWSRLASWHYLNPVGGMSAWENREDGSTIYILYEDHTMRAVEELVFALRFDAPGGRSSATPVLDECVREFGFVRVPFDPGGPD